MQPTWRHHGEQILPGVSLVVYVLLTWLFPSHLHTAWLGAGVVAAARTWEIRGGLIAAVAACLTLLWGLWRIDGPGFLTNPHLMGGYGWAMAAALALGYYVGDQTRQTRQARHANTTLRHAQQQLAALHQIAVSLSTTLDDRRLMEIILEQLGSLWGYDSGAILLVDEETGELVLAAARGYESPLGLRVPADRSICGAVLQSGQPLCVADVTRDPRYVGGVAGARSELAVPLAWEGKTLGVLTVESREPAAYGPADVALLTTVAEQAAAYLANARLHQHTRHLAITDAHTGLYNYRHYVEQVARLVNQAQLTGAPFALLMIDLDHFKRVNDTYGHPTGDQVLAQVADLIRLSCRHEDLIFRYGGEEFAVILPGADQEAAGGVAERIRARVAAQSYTTRQGRRLDFGLSVSIGVAAYPQHGLSQVDLILAADQALYAAKAAGRNRVVCPGAGQDLAR